MAIAGVSPTKSNMSATLKLAAGAMGDAGQAWYDNEMSRLGDDPTPQAAAPSQGPAQGGPEPPGAPNTSPSTAATDGLYKAVQQMNPPGAGWAELSAPGADNAMLGTRTPPSESPTRVLGKLVRGVY